MAEDRRENMKRASAVFEDIWQRNENKVVAVDLDHIFSRNGLIVEKLDPSGRQVLCTLDFQYSCAVSHGTYLCIECSGTHRSLGVHISFVRSCTMDTWSDQQLAMMKVSSLLFFTT